MNDHPMNAIIYIDGAMHRATELGTRFYVDHPSLPGRYCAQHSLKRASVEHLRAGGAVRTSGHRYSLRPDAPAPVPVDSAVNSRPSLVHRIWSYYRNRNRNRNS